MPSESNLSKELFSNSTVCLWFFVVAVYNGFVAVAALLLVISTFMSNNTVMKPFTPFLLLAAVFGFINTYMLFVLCNRGLNEGFKDKKTHMYY
jgi:uncharacterized membrane protein